LQISHDACFTRLVLTQAEYRHRLDEARRTEQRGAVNWDWLYTDWAPWAELAAGAVAVAVIAWWGERRRMRRSNIDAVGVVPWRDLAALASFSTILFGAVALVGWIRS